jgi:hypothetical protein
VGRRAALGFDDTIEHEARNGSNRTRVVLIFDVWRPELTEEERGLVATLLESVDAYSDFPPPGNESGDRRRPPELEPLGSEHADVGDADHAGVVLQERQQAVEHAIRDLPVRHGPDQVPPRGGEVAAPFAVGARALHAAEHAPAAHALLLQDGLQPASTGASTTISSFLRVTVGMGQPSTAPTIAR